MSRVDNNIHFLYSETFFNQRKEIQARLNKEFICGEVYVKGEWKKYTHTSKSLSSSLFPDSKVVYTGSLSATKYTPPTNKWRS